MSEEDLRKALRDAKPAEATQAALDADLARLPRTDLGNAQRLRRRFGADLRWVPEMGWLCWDGRRWVLDPGEAAVRRRAQETAESIRYEAATLVKMDRAGLDAAAPGAEEAGEGDAKAAQSLRLFGLDSQDSRAITAMIREAQPHLVAAVADLDADPWTVTIENGTIDLPPPERHGLRKGKTEPLRRTHAKTDLITKLAPVAWKAGTEPGSDIWWGFLSSIMPDAEDQLWLQRWFGYCLSGSTEEQCLVIFQGAGSNGKSTLIEAIRGAFGDYCATLNFKSLSFDGRGGGSDASPDLAGLPGKRVVFASEPNANVRLDEGLIKMLTGESTIPVRRLHRDFFDLKIDFKLVLSVNPKPVVRGSDHAIWRRIRLLPFREIITQPDRSLPQKLRKERATIFAWMVEGYRLWRREGLGTCPSIQAATQDYRDESDSIGGFIQGWCDLDGARRQTALLLYGGYVAWCEINGFDPVGKKKFGQDLGERPGLKRAKNDKGNIVYTGIDLVTDEHIREQARNRSNASTSSKSE